MSPHQFVESWRRRIQAEASGGTRAQIVARLARSSAIAGLLTAAIAFPGAAVAALTASAISRDVKQLPLALSDGPNPQTTRLLSSSGDLIAYFYQENRQDVPLSQIAPVMREAILSIEDTRFFSHGALDIEGTLRALMNNLSTGTTQGGSTLTQQLVKLLMLQQSTSDEQASAAVAQTPARKLRELKLAIGYEEKHTKNEILERYLNTAYYGGGAHGIAAAASRWFSVSPDRLTPAQAALLAGVVKNPSAYDPEQFPEAATQRRNTVLGAMAREGLLSAAEAKTLQAEPLGVKATRYPNGCVTSVASFSCDYVRRYLLTEPALGSTVEERRNALERGGLTIRSTIDIRMQEAVNEAVAGHVRPGDNAIGAIAMVEPGTGDVRGMAQSRPMGRGDGESFINFSVPREFGDSGGFQAGSTFKYFTLAAALHNGIAPSKTYNAAKSMVMPAGTYLDCEGGGTGLWKVSNSTSSGKMNMYRGARESVNTYFAQLERDAGLCNTVRMAQAMGIYVPFNTDGRGSNDVVPSFTLGVTSVSPLDMAAAYATAASGGMYCAPRPVDEIVDRAGTVIKKYPQKCTRVLSKDEAAQINDILRGLQQPGGFGYQNGTALRVPSAAKTGTTQENRAVWYVGYTPQLVAAAMIAGANSDGIPIPLDGQHINGRTVGFAEAAGSALAGPMWAAAMQAIQTWLDAVNFDRPPVSQPTVKDDKDAKDADKGDQSHKNDDG